MNKTKYPLFPVLLVDDEPQWLRTLSLVLERSGINHTILCQDSREVMDVLARHGIGLVLLDYAMPYISGRELLSKIVLQYPHIPVIVITGINEIKTAVECVQGGAFDYYVKGVEENRLLLAVRRALQMSELQQENLKMQDCFLHDRLEHPEIFSAMVTGHKTMRSIFKYIEAITPSSQPVLITGESGTGKELMARAVHRSSRYQNPWVPVNVAGQDDHFFSDTLFGHIKGAYTGADMPRLGLVTQAENGTLFLDEIGDLSPTSQAKLLRLLQEGEYIPLGSDRGKHTNARIIVATNTNLKAAMESGQFRNDLYYRLCTHHIHLPPLRERLGDLPLLLNHFLEKAACGLKKKKPTPPPELVTLLSTYHFPGNVRELESMIFDTVSQHKSGKLSMDSFKAVMGRQHAKGTTNRNITAVDPPQESALVFSSPLPTIAQTMHLLIREAMQRANGNQTLAASLLGISRPALSKRLKTAH